MPTNRSLAQEAMKTKGRPLQKMFERVPKRYDFLNRLLTFRLDEVWRKKAVKTIVTQQPREIMDVGTGTGDLAVRVARKLNNAHVTGYDFSPSMLEFAREKASKYNLNNIEFIEGDAAFMPFESGRFDVVCISFAFRNITFKNPNTGLYIREIFRTLRPGGKFVIVESSQPRFRLVRFLFHQYLNYIVSGIGGKISGTKSAYHYLAYSARNFYTQKELTGLLNKYGFVSVEHSPMLLGAAALTVASKPSA